jgi:hypothetical protein
MGASFHQIVDLRLNRQKDKVALLLNDGRHPDAFTAVIRPIGLTVSCAGVMPSPDSDNGSTPGSSTISGGEVEELEGVHTLQWMADGHHIVYSRVGALGAPTEVWLHLVGTQEGLDRQLYDEVSSLMHSKQ